MARQKQLSRGRKKGTKNLKRTPDGGYINQHGVTFTEAEKRALESAVVSANRRRAKMLQEVGKLPRYTGGKPTGDTVSSLQSMGQESDFILAEKSKSLQRFRDRETFDRYMGTLKKINTDLDGYILERTRHYKSNYMKALDNVYGDEAKDVKMYVRMMKPEKFREMVEKDELLEIFYVYPGSSNADKGSRLNQIRQSFGMKLKEEEIEE